MTTFDGFILTAFPPVAVIIILGICCIKNSSCSSTRSALLFLIVMLLFMLAWRLPFVIDRRYVLPVIVPGIPIAVLFFKTLVDKWAHIGQWLCGILLLIIAVTGTAKAMRFQESKPYLKEIPAVVHKEMQEHNLEQACVVALSNIGGYLPFSDTVTYAQVPMPCVFSSEKNDNSIFNPIDLHFKPKDLLLQYPVIYLLLSSTSPPDAFIKKWEAKYGQVPVLRYEFIRPKKRDERIQLFRINSPYKSAYKPYQEQLELYKKFNLLPNPDFSQKQKLPTDSPVVEQLTSMGIELTTLGEELFVPYGWQLYMPSLKPNVHVYMQYTDQNKLSLTARDSIITLIQTNAILEGGKKYQLRGCITIKDSAYFMINIQHAFPLQYRSRLCTISMGPGRYEFSNLIDLSQRKGFRIIDIELAAGKVEFEYLYLVDQAVFNN